MNNHKLKSHLAADPDRRNYSAMTLGKVVADLHSKRRTGPKPYTIRGVITDVGMDTSRRLVTTLEMAAASDSLVKHMLKLLENGQTIDIGNEATRAMLDTFASNELLPLRKKDVAAIKALAEGIQSDADHYGLGNVRAGNVEMARNLIAEEGE